jgi:hypothetical protein
MVNKKCIYNLLIAAALSTALLLQSSTVFAWGGHRSRSRHRHKGSYLYSSHYISPIVGGLTYLYLYSLANRKKETTYYVMPGTVEKIVVSSERPIRGRSESVVINIPNSNGSYTQVTLTKSGDGYVGPQGEYYTGHPTVEELKVLYGE